MRKLLGLVFIAAIITIASGMSLGSCRKVKSDKEKEGMTEIELNNKKEVMEFVIKFINGLNNELKDSIAYPDILKGNAFAALTTDSLKIFEGIDGKYGVYLNNGINLKINREKNGRLTILESHGLFVFPEDRVNIAKKTGMWNDTLNDAALADRIGDDAYFKYLQNQVQKKTSNIITFHSEPGSPDKTEGFANVINYFQNHTDQPIKSSDYVITLEVFEELDWGTDEDGYYVPRYGTHSKTKQGIPIPPHGTVSFNTVDIPDYSEKVKGIKIKLSAKQMQERFAPYTGNEYQEYLSSKANQ